MSVIATHSREIERLKTAQTNVIVNQSQVIGDSGVE